MGGNDLGHLPGTEVTDADTHAAPVAIAMGDQLAGQVRAADRADASLSDECGISDGQHVVVVVPGMSLWPHLAVHLGPSTTGSATSRLAITGPSPRHAPWASLRSVRPVKRAALLRSSVTPGCAIRVAAARHPWVGVRPHGVRPRRRTRPINRSPASHRSADSSTATMRSSNRMRVSSSAALHAARSNAFARSRRSPDVSAPSSRRSSFTSRAAANRWLTTSSGRRRRPPSTRAPLALRALSASATHRRRARRALCGALAFRL